MDRIIIIDDNGIRNELEAFIIANRDHIRLNSDMDEVSLGNNPALQEIISKYEEKYKVKIQSRDKIMIYRLNEIICLQSNGEKTFVKLISGKINTVNETLDVVEDQLQNFPFLRPNDQCLINLHHIAEIKDQPNAAIIMTNGDPIPLSDNRKEMIINSLNKFIK